MDRNVQALIDHATRGQIALPAAWTRMAETVTSLEVRAIRGRNAPTPASATGQAKRAVVTSIVEAVVAGQEPPEDIAGPVEVVIADANRREIEREIVQVAAERLSIQLTAAIHEGSDELIRSQLAPAMAEAVADVRRLAPLVAGVDFGSAPRILSAPAETRQAVTAIDHAARRYDATHATHKALLAVAKRPTTDVSFQRTSKRYKGTGESHIERVVWLATNVEPWVPTSSQERDLLAERLAANPPAPTTNPLTGDRRIPTGGAV